jgi:PAS domain-containing protein
MPNAFRRTRGRASVCAHGVPAVGLSPSCVLLPRMAPHIVYLLVLVVSVCLQGGLALYGARYRHLPSGLAFTGVSLGGAVWTLLVGAMAIAEPAQARVLLSLKYFAIGTTTISTFVLVLALTGRTDRLMRCTLPLLAAIPLVGAVSAWRDGWGMVREITWMQTVDLTWIARIAFGPVYWGFTGALYALLLSGCALLVSSIVRGARLLRAQALMLLAGMLVVMLCNVLLITGFADRRFDPMPVGLACSAMMLAWSTFRHGLLELVPVARSALVDALQDGALVLDAQGRVVDVNATMSTLLGDSTHALLGQPLLTSSLLVSALGVDAANALRTACTAGTEGLRVAVQGRWYDVHALPVGPVVRGASATVILLHDVTAQQTLLQEQERLVGELRAALSQVRTLTGLLPLCASCKQIRDADGSWQPMETYIRARTDAEFSHGICPSCVVRHYPEYSGS